MHKVYRTNIDVFYVSMYVMLTVC